MTVQHKRLKRLLKQMIDIYSPSGKEEEIIDFLKGYLKRRGLPVRLVPVDERRCNLIVGNLEADPRLALVGHLDTVTAYDLDRYACEETGDAIQGLGAADMKGGCAAMIEAFTAWHDAGGLPPGAVLCLVVGEEETGDGARQLMKELHFPWAVIGEPTGLTPCLRCFGYLEIEVATLGRRIHASVATPRQSPVATLLRKMLRLIRYFEAEPAGPRLQHPGPVQQSRRFCRPRALRGLAGCPRSAPPGHGGDPLRDRGCPEPGE